MSSIVIGSSLSRPKRSPHISPKGTVSRDFFPGFSHQSTPSGPIRDVLGPLNFLAFSQSYWTSTLLEKTVQK